MKRRDDVFLCFVPLLFQVDVRVMCSHACMMLLAMPCLDLCVLCVYFHAIWLDPCLHMLICLDPYSSMSMCQVSTCLHVCFYACMTRSMFSHAYVLRSMFSTCFILSPICSCTPCHVCVPRPRLSLSFHVLLQPFVALFFFLFFWPIGSDSIQTLWSLSLSIHLGPHQRVWIILIYMSMLACFCALCLCYPLQLQASPCLTSYAGLTLCGYIRRP